ncbi:MAG: spermidine/putrescine ABC transporter substrate-binding protein [Elusimicrobiota bacterium]|jgi:spermidine/putrescine-binding protein|nr:spermidine/putrescine ABC transporter substrate-binding protein [Elusimicrobiota bacterium]
MKKTVFVLHAVLSVVFMAFFSACSRSNFAGEVSVFVWEDYLPESAIVAFEKETGIRVHVLTYNSNESMLSKVKGSPDGTYDIAVPGDYMVKMMTEQGLLEEMKTEQLTNFKNLDLAYLGKYFDPDNKYSIPYMAGGVAIIVNKTRVNEKIVSLNQLFDPKYKDSIVILDDFRINVGAVARSLGYSFNTTNLEELSIISQKMEEWKPNIKLRDSGTPKSAMLSGETTLGLIWTGEIALCIEANSSDFEVVFPQEGFHVFLDNFVLLKGSKNIDNARKFIDFILRPDISAMISAEHPYPNPNKAAQALLPDSFKNNPAANIASDVFARGIYLEDIGSDVSKYDDVWTKFTR